MQLYDFCYNISVITCLPLMADAHGYYSPPTCEADIELDQGVICSPGCDTGYNLIDVHQSECLIDGSWSYTSSGTFCESRYHYY